MNEKYNVSFRCYFESDDGVRYNTHYNPQFDLADIPKWVECYRFTHPNCISISVKIWLREDAIPNYMDEENDGREIAT